MSKLVTEIWAWVCTESDGGEGIPAFQAGNMMMPLVGADRDRIESFRHVAEDIAKVTGLPVKLVRFSSVEVVEHLGRRH